MTDSTQTDTDGKTNWWRELRSILVIILIVLGIHSFIAKPFYIPSGSMMPNLLVGDRLLVTKYPYGFSYASASFHLLPPFKGRIFGHLPERGDIVVVERRSDRADLIKRVVGLPGDTIEVRDSALIINGVPVKREQQPNLSLAIDANDPCLESTYPGARVTHGDGSVSCDLPIIRETLPNGVSYNTIDLERDSYADNFGPVTVPADHVFLMGDNRDRSADSRFPGPLGLDGPVPFENISGRAEFVTFSLDGSSQTFNPVSWFSAMREGRAGLSLRAKHAKLAPPGK
ncbi:signal peptidase I [Sphingorhabdus soli]|uniref:Signal peptidase I n=1 Tax=Flavisphingopyxis soli TaxID=2601267 RepID=A0A5C6UMY7_9SPHN|nr:signal peptidase I [Sphingorhabdus soli]TXC73890.1 signal peptidase I [Sphingorhabdus soli]